MDTDRVYDLALALGIGLIIGLERGWKERAAEEGHRVAGLRTFGLVGLFGGLAAAFAHDGSPAVFAVGLATVAALAGVGYVLRGERTGDYGATTELALLVTYVLGGLPALGLRIEAAAAAVVVAMLLGFKGEIHQSLERLDVRELRATLQLLLIAVVVLPFLPDRSLGPAGALNPHALGWLVLLMAMLSYVGYFAQRILGARLGILVTAAVGGLTSSTAVTFAFARMARRGVAPAALYGAGIALASAAMAARIAVEVLVVNRALIAPLSPPLAALTLVPLAAALVVSRRAPTGGVGPALALRNPLEIRAALAFAALLALVSVGVRLAERGLGDVGVLSLAALSGLVDVDAITLSAARASLGSGADPAGALDPGVAVQAILLAAGVNTITKAVVATALGGLALGRWAGAILALGLAAAAGTYWLGPVH